MNEQEIFELLSIENSAELFARADSARKAHVGDIVHLRALIEISNICSKNCFYCGIRAANTAVERYALSEEEIISAAHAAKETGFKTVVLQSGESAIYPHQTMLSIIRQIKSLGLIITLSLGEKTRSEYADYKAEGADRYLLRIETTDDNIYSALHPGATLSARKECLYTLKELGFETGTGILVGLPGQTLKSIAKDIFFIQNFGAEMVGLGPFIPCENTPLAAEKGGSLDMALRALAAVRLALPNANIPATTAMEALAVGARKRALSAGANVLMPNLTPPHARSNYRLYPDKPATDYQAAVQDILSLGRHPL